MQQTASGQKVVWGARKPKRPAASPSSTSAAKKQLSATSVTESTSKKKSQVKSNKNEAAACDKGCCEAPEKGKQAQGRSYLRRYGFMRQLVQAQVSDEEELSTFDLEKGERSSNLLGEDMCKWGTDMIGGDVVLDAAAEVAAECCRLCLEADACCRQLCCAAMCCLRKLGASMLTGSSVDSKAQTKPSGSLVTVHLDLSGLDCADCASTVERTLKRNEAVVSVVVSAMTNKAEVTFDAQRMDEATIVKDIRALGFGAEIGAPSSAARLVLRVKPATAEDVPDVSAAVVELARKPGIARAVYKRKKGLLIVDYDPHKAEIRSRMDELTASGLDLSVVRELSGENSAQKQMRSWRWRFWVGAFLSVPVFLISFVFPHVPTVDSAFDEELTQGLSLGVFLCWLLATPVQFILAWPLYGSSVRALWYGHKANMDTLVILSTLTAYLYSSIAVIIAMAGVNFEGESFFETSAILLTLIMLGRYLEALARGKACDVVSSLRGEQATSALLLPRDALLSSLDDENEESAEAKQPEEQEEREVDVELVQPGDTIKVLPGAKVPVDGVVLLGTSAVDESLVTGESLPVAKRPGSLVLGGTINQHGVLHVQVTRPVSESALAAIGRLVEDAQASKPRLQRVADVVASYFVPVVLALALAVLALWISLSAPGVVDTDDNHWVPFSLQFAIAVLVVSCPCAIGLAVPLAVMVASGVGAKNGVVFKSGATIEACRHIDAVIFDKTGTLTAGRLTVVDQWWLDWKGMSEQQASDADDGDSEQRRQQLLGLIGSAERGSEHALARAIVSYVETCLPTGRLVEPEDYTAVPGRGLSARVLGHAVLVGNRQWMRDNRVALANDTDDDDDEVTARHENEGRTVVWAAIDGRAVCGFALEDALRPEAKEVVARLQRGGTSVWMLSGDQPRTVRSVASRLGIAEARAVGGLAPADKVDRVRRLQLGAAAIVASACGLQASASDDDNDGDDDDSPSDSDVGVAVGSGTDIAIAAGDVILLRDDLRGVLLMTDLARRAHVVIVANLTWALLYNAVAIPLAAGVLYPGTGFVIPPAAAGLSEILSTLPVILFSLMLRLYRFTCNDPPN